MQTTGCDRMPRATFCVRQQNFMRAPAHRGHIPGVGRQRKILRLSTRLFAKGEPPEERVRLGLGGFDAGHAAGKVGAGFCQ